MTTGTALTVPDPARRADLGSFVARVVQLDRAATVRLRRSGGDESATVTAWATTPFEVLAARSVPGAVEPADVAVSAAALLTALTVERAATVDPGAGAGWRAELPPDTGWTSLDPVPAAELAELAERALAVLRESGSPGPSAELLDRTSLTVPDPAGPAVRVPLRCLFALSGLGLLAETGPGEPIGVSTTRSWLRLDTPLGAVVRRRVPALPLLS